MSSGTPRTGILACRLLVIVNIPTPATMTTCTSTCPASDRERQVRSESTTEHCYRVAGRYAPRLAAVAALFGVVAMCLAFAAAPGILEEGRHNLIVFIHIPSGWMSVLLYLVAATAVLGQYDSRPLSSMVAYAVAPTGALFAFLSLWTGALWMKPNWGVWWIWEPRQTSQLLLLFLFLGYVALQEALDDRDRADRAAGSLVAAGMFALPALYFSLRWWSANEGTLDLRLAIERGTEAVMIGGLLTMTLALMAYSCAAALTRLRIVILERERSSDWVARRSAPRR